MKVTWRRHGWVHMFITHQPTLTLQLHNFDLFRTCRTALLRGNWQDFNWHNASRGPSAIAELLVLGRIHLLNRNIVWDTVLKLAYNMPKRDLSTLKVTLISWSYDKLKTILWQVVRYFVNRAPEFNVEATLSTALLAITIQLPVLNTYITLNSLLPPWLDEVKAVSSRGRAFFTSQRRPFTVCIRTASLTTQHTQPGSQQQPI